ncbi:MAG: hypothetical protein ABI128_00725, partial [Rhodanobacter sp.]
VHWTAHASDGGALNRHAGALGLRRVPLVNHHHRVCGMVVLAAPVPAARQEAPTARSAARARR